ncbi:hypothetical protein KR767_10350 [Luteibacter anthropi]|uniref:hypothetical protein n=1 Tax=Luteibacter anthropi TaxID=564369 RepID=UPI0020324800|nr:hypothetical protein [Luteibacter anthropi]URX62961.1 hypothetical protein KR767_02505 [Luteibacter anthropi]URX64411.1 hypothetical protein KR767_10350 [Luteibacter anthropi]
MKDINEHWILEDDDASTERLLNEATEWLAYAQGTARLLAEVAHEEADDADHRDLSLAIGGVAALVAVGQHCVQRAHVQVMFESPLLPDTEEVRHGD